MNEVCVICDSTIDDESYKTTISNGQYGEVVFCADCWSMIVDAVTNHQAKTNSESANQ
jgi:hypothetical protein